MNSHFLSFADFKLSEGVTARNRIRTLEFYTYWL